ncbi:hypothetical protein ABPG72_021688 [Tetrahymena utriculariae]
MILQKQVFQSKKKFLKSSLSSHTNLEIDLYNNKLDFEDVQEITAALMECKSVVNLILQFEVNRINDDGANLISLSLNSFKYLTNLELWISQNIIGDTGIQSIAASLSNCNQIKSLILGLYRNNFGNKGLVSIATGLNSCILITDLLISLYNKDISHEGYYKFGQYLSGLPKLISLKLHHEDDYKILFSKELINCKNIKVLYLNLPFYENKIKQKDLKIKRLVIQKRI